MPFESKSIYQDQEEKNLNKKRINLFKLTAFIALLLVIFAAINFLLRRVPFREGNVLMKIELPETVVAGEKMEYKIKIENKNKVSLLNSKLTVFYPEKSIVLNQENNPVDSLVDNIDIGTIESKSEKELNLKSIITGEPGEIKKIKAVLTYKIPKSKTVFEKTTEEGLTISRLRIPTTFVGPPNAISGQSIQLIFDFRNEGEDDINDLRVKFIYPDGFDFSKSSPLTSEDNNIWNIAVLEAGNGKRILVDGRISGLENETKSFIAILQRKIGDKFVDLQRNSTQLVISNPLLSVNISVNNKEEFIAQAGDVMNYIIKFSNNSSNNFSALELKASLSGAMVDFSTVDTDGFFNETTKTILWNAAVNPLLSNLGPNQEGEVRFKIKLKNDFPKVFGSKNLFVKVDAVLETPTVPPDFHLEKVSAKDSLITKISSKLDFESLAFYDDSDIRNSGPVPPRVGQKTTYTIHWRIINEGNDLVNVRVSSFLMPGISWEDNFKASPNQPDPVYDSRTGEVVWSLPVVPAGSGSYLPKFDLAFQVGLIPGSNQSGKNMEILKDVKFEAVDNFTNKSIVITKPGINTGNIKDRPGAVR